MSATGRRVRHYKGGEYVIVGHGREEATRASVVVYKAAVNQHNEDLYTRPYQEFYGAVEVDGQRIARFSFID